MKFVEVNPSLLTQFQQLVEQHDMLAAVVVGLAIFGAWAFASWVTR